MPKDNQNAKRLHSELNTSMSEAGEPSLSGLAQSMDNMMGMMTKLDARFDKLDDKMEARLTGIENRMRDLEKKMKKQESICADMDDQISQNTMNLNKHDKDVTELKEKYLAAEVRARQKNIILKGLPMHAAATPTIETWDQTFQVVGNWLKELGIDDKVLNYNARRFLGKQGMKTTPFVLLTVAQLHHRTLIYQAIAKTNTKVGVTYDLPPDLVDKMKALETKAFNIRSSSNKKTKTKIVLEGIKLVLKTKSEGTKDFVPIEKL